MRVSLPRAVVASHRLEAAHHRIPVRPALDQVLDLERDPFPCLAEVAPEPPEALMAVVDGLDAGEQAGGAELDLGGDVLERALEVAVAPRAESGADRLLLVGRHRRKYRGGTG
jgi:hypothetical protein